MKLSIVIVSWNVKDLLQKCLASIFAYIQGVVLFEVIVIDNASGDGSPDMVEKLFPQVTLIKNSQNTGFAKANNQAVKIAKGEYILLLNPDTECIEDSVSKVVQKMDQDQKTGVLGCRLLNADRSVQPSVRRFPRLWQLLVIFCKLHKIFPGLLDSYLAKDFDYGHESPADQVMGAFFCVRKKVIEQIGMLDEGYFIWFEEVDFCVRAKQAGWKITYWPGTSVIHHGGRSFSQQQTFKKQLWFFKSAMRYLKKFGFRRC